MRHETPDNGTLAVLTGLGDMLFVHIPFRAQLDEIGSAGVLGTVMSDERAGPKTSALWFASKSALLVALGNLPASPNA